MKSLLSGLLEDKIRTFLTILSVFGGTLVVMTLLTCGNALKQTLLKDIASGGGNTVRIHAGVTSMDYKGIAKGVPLTLTEKDVSSIKALPFFRHMEGVYRGNVAYGIPGKRIEVRIIEGVKPSYFSLKNINIGSGHFFTLRDDDERRRVLVMGYKLAEEMFPHTEAVGKKVLVNGYPFTVIGVTIKSFKLTDFDGRDAYTSWIPQATYYGMFHPFSYSFMMGEVVGMLPETAVEDMVHNIMVLHHHVSPDDKSIIQVDDKAVMQSNIKKFLTGFEVFLGLIGAITLGLAGLSVATVVFLSVRENYKYIGVQMALGATPARILGRYLVEGVFTTFTGGLLGIGVGDLLLWGLNRFLQGESQKYSFFAKIDFTLSPSTFMVIMIILLVVSLIASIFPAYKASSILPAEALRYE